ncbi:hypothetical protein V8F20_009731 [Naviculisporaceae sp. PSN 640]
MFWLSLQGVARDTIVGIEVRTPSEFIGRPVAPSMKKASLALHFPFAPLHLTISLKRCCSPVIRFCRISNNQNQDFLARLENTTSSDLFDQYRRKPTMGQENHPGNLSLLQRLYQDLSRISECVPTNIILHPADRDLFNPSRQPIRGVEAVQAHEDSLIAATEGTLVMDIQNITVNEHFGTVLGVLRASKTGREVEDLAIPFCGVWRFQDGKPVEHWENAADPRALERWLAA